MEHRRAVHWYEGVFLRPHHFQAAEQRLHYLMHTGQRWDHPNHWGLRSIQFDEGRLAANVLEILSLQARSREGTLVSVPADGPPPQLSFQGLLGAGKPVYVFLALPNPTSGEPCVPPPDADGDAKRDDTEFRYRVVDSEREDENKPGNPERIEFRGLNFRLLSSPEPAPANYPGYELIPVACVRRSTRPDGAAEFDPVYIPPLVCCEASEVLQREVLRSLYNRVGSKAGLIAMQVRRGLDFDSHAPGEAKAFNQLRLLNEAQALLGALAALPGVHPVDAYFELCQVVGRLAVLGPQRTLPDLLPYNHEELGKCFFDVKAKIDFLLDQIEDPKYQAEPFVGVGSRTQVTMKPKWLEEQWYLAIGVYSSLDSTECARLLQTGGVVMKVGEAEQVENMIWQGQGSLILKHVAAEKVPGVLPRGPRHTYFQLQPPNPLDRDRSEGNQENARAWEDVRAKKTLAIRLYGTNQVDIRPGEETMRLQRPNKEWAELRFTLYAVPPGKADLPRTS